MDSPFCRKAALDGVDMVAFIESVLRSLEIEDVEAAQLALSVLKEQIQRDPSPLQPHDQKDQRQE